MEFNEDVVQILKKYERLPIDSIEKQMELIQKKASNEIELQIYAEMLEEFEQTGDKKLTLVQ